jgi:hypothetical protein
MNSRRSLGLVIVTMIGIACSVSNAVAQQKTLKEQLVGTWSFVSSTAKLPDGSPLWGSNPRGLSVFSENGRVTEVITRSDRPKFASNNRLQGTADDNKATVWGTIATFGTYAVDEGKGTYTIKVEGSTYPNWESTEITRPITITGDEMAMTNPAPSIGGPPSRLVWRRIK